MTRRPLNPRMGFAPRKIPPPADPRDVALVLAAMGAPPKKPAGKRYKTRKRASR